MSTLLFTYGLSTTIGAPIAGWITKHTAVRKLPLSAGLILGLVATALLMLGSTAWMLLSRSRSVK